MARTFGGASTDSIVTGLTTNSTLRSYSIWGRPTSDGGTSGRFWAKQTTATQSDQLATGTAPSTFAFNRVWSGGQGQWSFARPAYGGWHHIAVVYDSGSTANVPTMYLDGVSQTVATDSAPSGTRTDTTDAFVIGNRTNDNARNFAGDLAEFGVWNVLLTAADVTALYQGDPYAALYVQTASLVAYYPLDLGISPEPDTSGHQTAGTVTGTVRIAGPHDLRERVTSPLPIMANGRI
jgi:hypothetical protein